MGNLLIKGVTLEGKKKDILIEGNIISKIADNINVVADEILSGENMAAIPGLYNMHTHSAMTLMRSCLEDAPLFEWLDEVWRLEKYLDDDVIYWGTKLACLEMIKCGVTCFNDMYWRVEHAAKAIDDMGMRAMIHYCLLDGGDEVKQRIQIKECEEAYEASKGWNPRVKFGIAIHGDYTVCDENISWVVDFAKRHDLLIHTHIAETRKELDDSMSQYGISPVKRMEEMGVLSEKTIAAHCVWIDEEDIAILGKYKVNVVHNINSNLKLASGYKFKNEELKAAGANVVFGTDGAASSNNLDILEAMKTSAFLQKAWRNDPAAMPISDMMKMATVNSAKALGLDSGEIKEGKLADIVLVNTNSPAFVPQANFLGNLIYSANSSCVDTVICDGKVIMKGRVVPGEEEILRNAQRCSDLLYSKANS